MSSALYPASCALCKQSLLRFSSVPICDTCWLAIAPQSGSLCVRCGEDLGLAPSSMQMPRAADVCSACEERAPEFARAVGYGVYEGELRGIIHLLKYEGLLPIGQRLGAHLSEAVAGLAIPGYAPVLVVPVPLHPAKRRSRGFNHADLIARGLTAALRRRAGERRWHVTTSVLERRRATESQARLSPEGRRRNLRGAFSVRDAALVKGQQVLLVDDIYTTGATARACSRTLLRAGAAAVWVATVARAQREGVALWDPAVRPEAEHVGTR